MQCTGARVRLAIAAAYIPECWQTHHALANVLCRWSRVLGTFYAGMSFRYAATVVTCTTTLLGAVARLTETSHHALRSRLPLLQGLPV